MKEEIEVIERLLVNSIPAKQVVIVGEWLVRFNEGYTYRANCICPFGRVDTKESRQRLKVSEELYKKNHMPCIVKYTPALQNGFDEVLMEEGYKKCKLVYAMTVPVKEYKVWPEIKQEEEPDLNWLEASVNLSKVSSDYEKIYCEAMKNIVIEKTFVSVVRDGNIIGCGYGTLERGYVGIYDLHVDEHYRRQGIGTAICKAILQWGKEHGTHTGYLVVHSKNENAIRLYEQNGFKVLYEYQFYEKEIADYTVID